MSEEGLNVEDEFCSSLIKGKHENHLVAVVVLTLFRDLACEDFCEKIGTPSCYRILRPPISMNTYDIHIL